MAATCPMCGPLAALQGSSPVPLSPSLSLQRGRGVSLPAVAASGAFKKRSFGVSAVLNTSDGLKTESAGVSGRRHVEVWEWSPDAEGPLEQPTWTGRDPMSRVVNAIIAVPPLFALLRLGARQLMISTAEKKGIPWRERAEQLRNVSELHTMKEDLESKDIVYPSYYLQKFHAYNDGNLCWEAAFEVEAATAAMCQRAFPLVQTPRAASDILRGGWLAAIERHHLQHSDQLQIRAILDVGCAVGISTSYLAEAYPDADVTGLDLSPYFLAVASYREKEAAANGSAPYHRPIRWLHALGESTGLPDASFDLISIAFVIHECPTAAIVDLLREAKRLLRAGGTLAITDNSPKSKVIQSLPAPIFTLMKSTEPWSDQYFSMNIEQAAVDLGFHSVTTVLSDPRHRTITATA